MNTVIARISLWCFDMPNFVRKLQRYVGKFRIEAQDYYDYTNGYMRISFDTDKVEINEGEIGEVDLTAKTNKRGSWYFIGITKYKSHRHSETFS